MLYISLMSNKRTSIILLVLSYILLGTNCIIAQNSEWMTVLPMNEISVMKATEDYLWFGSKNEGLGRLNFESGKIDYYNNSNSLLYSNNISAIVEDGNSNVWIGVYDYGGVIKITGDNWTEINAAFTGLPSNIVTCLAVESDSIIWIGTQDKGLASYDGKQWNIYNQDNSHLPNNNILAITVDDLGNKWTGTQDCQIARYDGSDWENFGFYDANIPYKKIISLSADGDNNIIALFSTQSLLKYSNGQWSTLGYNFNAIKNLVIDDNKIYAVSGNQLEKYEAGNWSEVPVDYLPVTWHQQYSSIEVDKEGNIWIGMYNPAGLLKYNKTDWEFFNVLQLPDSYVTDIVEDDTGNIWISSRQGITRYNDDDWFTYSARSYTQNKDLDNVQYNYATSLAFDNSNNLWAGTRFSGLMKYENSNWELVDNGGNGFNSVKALCTDLNGNLWMETGILYIFESYSNYYYNNSITRFNGIEFSSYVNDLGVVSANEISCDNNNIIWIATNSGLLKYYSGTWSGIYRGDLPSNTVLCVAVDEDNSKWVGTDKGVAIYDGFEWKLINTDNSQLPSNKVRSIWFEKTGGKTWFATDNGLACFDRSNWEIYNSDNSPLRSNDLSKIFIDKNNNKWIATVNKGLAVFNSDGITAVQRSVNIIPDGFNLSQNYPNPFNPATTIEYSIPENSNVRLEVFNILGEKVVTLVNEYKPAGNYRVTFETNSLNSTLPSGVYIYKINSSAFQQIKKMVLIR